MPSDTIIISGRTYTLGYAVHRGWAKPNGTLVTEAASTEPVIDVSEGDFDPADVDPTLTRGQRAAATRARNKAQKAPEPLKPQNVDHSGNPVTDQETLDEIVAKTEAMEQERKASLVIPPAGEEPDASE